MLLKCGKEITNKSQDSEDWITSEVFHLLTHKTVASRYSVKKRFWNHSQNSQKYFETFAYYDTSYKNYWRGHHGTAASINKYFTV